MHGNNQFAEQPEGLILRRRFDRLGTPEALKTKLDETFAEIEAIFDEPRKKGRIEARQ